MIWTDVTSPRARPFAKFSSTLVGKSGASRAVLPESRPQRELTLARDLIGHTT